MAHKIVSVDPDGIGSLSGLRAGDEIIAINGEEVIDEIDYQALTANSRLAIDIRRADGSRHTVHVHKEDWEGLGLHMADTMICTPRVCKNNCVFCFVAQMPKGMRPSLYVKDDDWRMSLMMGNFITLTNVDDREFDRILRRRASPLYISVHTTNMALRKKMLRNPDADRLMDRLRQMKDAGLKFHCQVVLCPCWNDGSELERTLKDLIALYPATRSVALVPVGLTRFREKLTHLDTYDAAGAAQVLDTAEIYRRDCLEKLGTRLIFPADEFYCLSGRPVPPDAAYEDYCQLENGVGMLRQFEDDMAFAAGEPHRAARPRRVTLACGSSISPFMRQCLKKYAPDGVDWEVRTILNDFFGRTVTVTGLLTGQDLSRQLKDVQTDEILLSGGTVRNEGDLFLDDMSVAELRAALPAPLTLVHGGGDVLFDALLG